MVESANSVFIQDFRRPPSRQLFLTLPFAVTLQSFLPTFRKRSKPLSYSYSINYTSQHNNSANWTKKSPFPPAWACTDPPEGWPIPLHQVGLIRIKLNKIPCSLLSYWSKAARSGFHATLSLYSLHLECTPTREHKQQSKSQTDTVLLSDLNRINTEISTPTTLTQHERSQKSLSHWWCLTEAAFSARVLQFDWRSGIWSCH